jgi:hypothetical protein
MTGNVPLSDTETYTPFPYATADHDVAGANVVG